MFVMWRIGGVRMTVLHVLVFGPRDLFISADVVAARFDRLPVHWVPSRNPT